MCWGDVLWKQSWFSIFITILSILELNASYHVDGLKGFPICIVFYMHPNSLLTTMYKYEEVIFWKLKYLIMETSYGRPWKVLFWWTWTQLTSQFTNLPCFDNFNHFLQLNTWIHGCQSFRVTQKYYLKQCFCSFLGGKYHG
jgi:hypothetical protein